MPPSLGKAATTYCQLRPDMSNRPAGPVQAHLLLMVACLPILGMLVIAPILPEIQRHFAAQPGISYLVPLVLTAPALCIVLFSPFVGRLATAFGLKRVLLAALLIYAMAATAPLYIDSIQAIIETRLIVGAAEAVLMTGSTTLLAEYFEGASRERYLSMQVIYTSVSAIIFLLLGGALGQAGWRAPFTAYFVALALVPCLGFLIWDPAVPTIRLPAQPSAPIPWRGILPILVLTFVAGGCMNLISVELGYLVEGAGSMSSVVKGIAAAMNSGGIAVGAGLMTFKGDAGRIHQLCVALLCTAFGYALIWMSGSIPGIIGGGALAGAGGGFYIGWLLSALNRPLVSGNRGRAVGVWMSCYFLATVLVPIMAVALTGALGNLRMTMGAFGLLTLAIGAAAFPMLRRRI